MSLSFSSNICSMVVYIQRIHINLLYDSCRIIHHFKRRPLMVGIFECDLVTVLRSDFITYKSATERLKRVKKYFKFIYFTII